MTTAFNLSQIANYLNTSGQLNLATGVTGTLPQANGGTGATSLASVAVTSLTAGSGISLSGSVGAVTITNTGGAGGAAVVSSATDVTLTATSNRVQAITMTTSGKNVILPNATTVTTLGGPLFIINNTGVYPFNVCTSDGYSLISVPSGGNISLGLFSSASANSNWVVGDGLGVISVTTGSVTAVTPVTGSMCVTALSSTAALITYMTGTTTANAVVATISGSTISYGTPWTGTASITSDRSVCAALSATAVMSGFYSSSGATISLFSLVISGTTVTASAITTVANVANSGVVPLRKLNSTQAVLMYNTGTNAAQVRVVQHNGTSAITLGAVVQIVGTSGFAADCVALTTTSFAAFYDTFARIGTVSGTTITLGTQSAANADLSGATRYYAYAYSATECGVLYYSSTSGLGFTTSVYSVSGTAITLSTQTAVGLSQPNGTDNRGFAQLDTLNAHCVFSAGAMRLEYIPTVGWRFMGLASAVMAPNTVVYGAIAPLSATSAIFVGPTSYASNTIGSLGTPAGPYTSSLTKSLD